MRSQVRLKVEVCGRDAQGNPFLQTAYAKDTSYYGARLDGLECLKGPGDIVQVTYKRKTTKFRVAWVGQPGSKEHGHIGLQSLEPRKNIWSIKQVPAASRQPLGDRVRSLASAAAEHQSSPQPPWQPERRRFTRHRCLGKVEFRIAGNRTTISGKLMDISLGGCYVQALGTCLAGTLLEIVIEACGRRIQLDGRVAVAGSSKGMGIEFVSGGEGLKELPNFIDLVRQRYSAIRTRPAAGNHRVQPRPTA